MRFFENFVLFLSHFAAPWPRPTGDACPDGLRRGATFRAKRHIIVIQEQSKGMLVPVTPAYGSMWENTSLGPTCDVVSHSRYYFKSGTMRSFMPTLTVVIKLDSQHRGLSNGCDVAK